MFPIVEVCPSATCKCAATPIFPDGYELDRKGKLNGVMAAYAEQVLICTGQDDWASKIEEEQGGNNLAADLKTLFGRGGLYSDPYHNVAVVNASFPSTRPPKAGTQTTSAYLMPSFKYVPWLPRISFDSVQALAKGFLLPKKLHPAHKSLSSIHQDRLLRKEDFQNMLLGVQDVQEFLILICGHGGRDLRCGIMGPLLREEFEKQLGLQGTTVSHDAIPIHKDNTVKLDIKNSSAAKEEEINISFTARVGLISHIGGHKYAGNVIIYVPPNAKTPGHDPHPLAGMGIWYGRVEPKHAEGIVRETVLNGNVIRELYRGAINQNRELIYL